MCRITELPLIIHYNIINSCNYRAEAHIKLLYVWYSDAIALISYCIASTARFM